MHEILNPEPAKQPPEPRPPKYIMIRQPLQKCFNASQWSEISGQGSSAYLGVQNKIVQKLLNCQQLFNCYFGLFYDNHVRLYHWYLLAREKHHVIKPYTFTKLLRKTKDQHRDDMKFIQIQQAREREREKEMKAKAKEQEILAEETKPQRYKIDDLSNQIFNFMATKSKTASLLVWQKPWSFKKHTKFNSNNQVENSCNSTMNGKWTASKARDKDEMLKKIDGSLMSRHDFHDLYIQTFHACDGPRYIFYNYEKHMKGLSQKDKYNTFIRGPSKNKVIDLRLTQNSEEEPVFKEIKSCDLDRMRSLFEYSSFGKAVEDNSKKKTSKVVFRRMKNRNVGKFIRK